MDTFDVLAKDEPNTTPSQLAIGSLAASNLQISATNDQQLIDAWLSRSNLSGNTIRSARKEAERFLMWVESRGKM